MKFFERLRSPAPEPEPSPDDWLSVEVNCESFILDLITARLESDGVEVRRSSLDGLSRTHGAGLVGNGKRVGFRRADATAVEAALRDAELL